MESADLNIVEIPHESGGVRFRYQRVLSGDGSRWIRHGLFVEYGTNGQVVAEGSYVNGKEEGLWHSYYPSGQLASKGQYSNGAGEGDWHFWSPTGAEEPPVHYRNGEEVRN